MLLERLEDEVKNCKKCDLYRARKNAVPGEGSGVLGVMIVGEAPGAREDEVGKPFVGAAGQILNTVLDNLGVARRDVYITNVVKCRPPKNRAPTSREVAACMPYLLRQISILKPRKIVALGLTSGRALLGLLGERVDKIGDVRGKCFRGQLAGVHVEICVTYHPAALLRDPTLRRQFEDDLATFFRWQ
ncbi:MAG: uracil-DNA glycosylase family protein [Pyrobaculum sp.]